ncbi:WD repeat-containing protein 3 isoform X2 [Pieris napi]|uniref:WD repeat-containing protein 3 isoform X1 n=1 Tax=Pieris napi TaxID=78633 RepID=UPI001FBA11E3|nr:WD repeat-containing protein 3 isoform X1 [Pieris napi]XP_047517730.1 WD repeat-containing protein 3 isoform X2 [Pieris napi]
MGLTKQYLRYAPSGIFNVVASSDCNISHVTLNGISGRYIAVGACEHVIIWDMRLGEKAQVITGEKVAVSQIACSPTGNHMAVGYVDGNINVYDLHSNEVICVFAGHKSAITCLQYDEQGHRIVSGSKDTEVILWDVVSETGIARFSGHKGIITSVLFINGKNCVISSSKDTFVKFWDIETKHCFKTLGGHQTEVWSSILLKEERYLVTGSTDQELRVWKLVWTDKIKDEDKITQQLEIVKLEDGDSEESSVLQCHQVGTLVRGGKGRVVGMATDPGQKVLACYGTDSLLELFAFCSDEDAKLRMNKRIKKQKKRLAKLAEESDNANENQDISEILTLSDEVRRLTSMKLSGKMKSTTLLLGMSGELRVGVSLASNTVEMHSLNISESSEVKCLKQITIPGHQKEPRCVTFSSDNLAILSASVDSIKIWNRNSQSCLRTIPVPCGRPVSACFAPGDRHALVGCVDGQLLLIDVAAGTILESVPAHTTNCAVVGLTPDLRGCYSGGGDKTVKLWQFELIDDPTGESKAKVLSLLHTRTLELEETVTAVKISPNSKFIAVALLDSTVKIFFLDTFKFYLSLYGHKLPVLSLDISYDSNLIATGSADRNVKIWGMDFGDCHKSIFAHNDSVTALQFVPSTHYFFTASKDGKVKQWDGDSYDNIIILNGHAGECYGLSVGAGGLHVASCGSDRALRLYSRTDEPLVLGDQDEEEEGLATGDQHAPVPGLPGLTMPTKKTIGAEKAADSLLECLSVGAEYASQVAEAKGAPVQPPVLMAAYNCSTAEDFLLATVRKIRSSDLEESLLLLPFNSACEIVKLLPTLLERGDSTELLCRLAFFLVRVHHAPLVANRHLLKYLIQIQAKANMRLTELRDMVGYNLHAIQWLQRDVEANENEQLFREATNERRANEKRTRRKRALKRPIVTVT